MGGVFVYVSNYPGFFVKLKCVGRYAVTGVGGGGGGGVGGGGGCCKFKRYICRKLCKWPGDELI